ncbi:glycosyl hydrolase family 43, partial [Bacteroides salyersiae]
MTLFLTVEGIVFAQSNRLVNNSTEKSWLDTSGNPINAHGGGVLYHEGTYYW